MLCFLVVNSFIVANDDQLRISFIILQTSHFFYKTLLICLGTGGGHDPSDPIGFSAEYATDCHIVISRTIFLLRPRTAFNLWRVLFNLLSNLLRNGKRS